MNVHMCMSPLILINLSGLSRLKIFKLDQEIKNKSVLLVLLNFRLHHKGEMGSFRRFEL